MTTGSFASFEAAYKPEHPAWFGGDENKFFFRVEDINLRSGSKLTPQMAGVTAIVGSNNAGKSTILREIKEYLKNGVDAKTKSILSMNFSTSDDISNLFSWLGKHAIFQPSTISSQQDQIVRMNEKTGFIPHIEYHWNRRRDHGVASLAPFFCFYGNAEERLKMTSSIAKRNETADPPSHPVHSLEGDRELRAHLSEISERVFHQPLTLDSLSATVRLRVGRTDVPVPPVDDVSDEYRVAISNLPPLDDQGDGMRSFFGQILPIMAANYPIVILDEPEAFLHPPQARALGVELGRLARDNKVQVIVATHDRSFLTGLLESESDVSVVRISRTFEESSSAYQLDSEILRNIWRDPVLKYTNVLDSLFHKVVVLAESEIDCGYLVAALDNPQIHADKIPKSEYLFVQTGGKAGFPKVAAALRAVGVPIVVAPDFDLLRDKSDLQKLVESLGGEWGQEEETLWKRAMNSFLTPRDSITIDHVLKDLERNFRDRRELSYNIDAKEEFHRIARHRGSPFAELKKYGIAAFRNEASQAIIELLQKIEKVGIVPVHAGELEGLAPNVVSRKGPAWLTKALEQNEQNNEKTRQHIERIVKVSEQLVFGT